MPEMNCFPLRGRSRLRFAAAAAIATSAVAASAMPALAAESELVSRGDGVAGAFPIEPFRLGNAVVTADGTTAYFVLAEADGGWAKSTGLYRRDVVTNRTTLIASGGDIRITSLADNGRYLGFSTAKGLVGSDTNKTIDLYGYDATAKRYNLVSRTDGANGKPLGVTGGAYITRDAKSALIGTKSGIMRRDLATGRTTKIGDGTLAGNPYAYLARKDDTASADGKVYWAGDKIVSPRATYTLAGGADASPIVSPSGRWVGNATYDASGPEGKTSWTVLDTTTGVTTPVDVAALFGADARPVGFTAAETVLLRRTAGAKVEIVEASLTGATPKVIATYPKDKLPESLAVTPSGKFAFSGDGAVFLYAADGVSIPGGADLSSPATSMRVFPGCRASGWPFYTPAEDSTLSTYAGFGPGIVPGATLSTLRVRVVNRSGAVIADRTAPASEPFTVRFPSAGHPYKVTGTTTYSDGRSATETWSIAAPAPICGNGF